jgi:hypothetical protein
MMVTMGTFIGTLQGFPPVNPHPFPSLPGQDEVQVALADLLANAEQYIVEARETGYEVPEDVDATPY